MFVHNIQIFLNIHTFLSFFSFKSDFTTLLKRVDGSNSIWYKYFQTRTHEGKVLKNAYKIF